jgi:hypothetical protein
MAEIINLADKRPADPNAAGNGAREALIAVAQSLPNDTGQNDAEKWADWILLELAERGFLVGKANDGFLA